MSGGQMRGACNRAIVCAQRHRGRPRMRPSTHCGVGAHGSACGHRVRRQRRNGAQSQGRCGRGGPSPGADVAGGIPGADVAGVGPVPVQMWERCAQSGSSCVARDCVARRSAQVRARRSARQEGRARRAPWAAEHIHRPSTGNAPRAHGRRSAAVRTPGGMRRAPAGTPTHRRRRAFRGRERLGPVVPAHAAHWALSVASWTRACCLWCAQLVVAFGISPLLDSFGSDGVSTARAPARLCLQHAADVLATRSRRVEVLAAAVRRVAECALLWQIGYALVMGGCSALAAVPVCERVPARRENRTTAHRWGFGGWG